MMAGKVRFVLVNGTLAVAERDIWDERTGRVSTLVTYPDDSREWVENAEEIDAARLPEILGGGKAS